MRRAAGEAAHCTAPGVPQAVGFDMDYTLAQYRPETFEALAHKETVDKLVSLGFRVLGLKP